MMTTLFQYLLQLNILAFYIIPCLIIIRFLLNKFPKRITIYIWLILAIRLLFPFTISSSLSLFQGPVNTNQLPTFPSDFMNVQNVTDIIRESTGSEVSTIHITSKLNLGTTIWLCGFVIIMLYSCLRIIRLTRRLQDSIQLKDNIYSNDHITTPFVFGIFRPRIYIPSQMKTMDIQTVLLHEQTHIHTHDPMKRLFAFLITCIYWFNPLVWIAYYLFQQDMEIACDERVVIGLDQQQRASYSEMLVYVSRQTKTVSQYIIPFSSHPIKQRITRILNYKKTKLITVLLLSCIFIMSGFVLLTNKETHALSAIQSNTEASVLYAKRSENVGDASAVSDIIHSIWQDAGEIELLTDKKPYGIRINILGEKEKEVLERVAFQNAKLAFALIKNTNDIYISQGDTIIFHLSREQIMSLLPDINLSEAYDSLEVFTKLYEYQLDLTFLSDFFKLPEQLDITALKNLHFLQENSRNGNGYPVYDSTFYEDVMQNRDSEIRILLNRENNNHILIMMRYIDGDLFVYMDTTRDHSEFSTLTYRWKSELNYHPEKFDAETLYDLINITK